MNCSLDSECPWLYDCLSNQCTHKDLLPLTPVELIFIPLLTISSVISTVGGVGGGIFFFPILTAIYRLEPKLALAISLASVSGILTARYFMTISERHLRRDKPLINYDIAIIYCPSIIIGTIFGVMMNKASPNWILLTLVSIFMGLTFLETWKKGKKYREEEMTSEKANKAKALLNLNGMEMRHIKKIQDIVEGTNSEDSSVVISKSRVGYTDLESDVAFTEPQNPLTRSFLRKYEKSLQKILEDEACLIPKAKLSILLVNLSVLTLFFCLQGNKSTGSPIGIEYCGSVYWLLQFAYIPFGLTILFFSVILLNREYQEKLNSGYLFLPSDIQWTPKNAFTSIFIGLVIGFTAAILGVGGAMICGPLLLKMGFHPQEATYTASFMASFTAIAGSTQYIIAGMVKWDYTLMCFVIGILGLLLGMNWVMKYVKKQNKASIIIFSLAICIGFSTLVLIYNGVEKTVEDFKMGRAFDFKEIC